MSQFVLKNEYNNRRSKEWFSIENLYGKESEEFLVTRVKKDFSII